jgi:hypothetical protein
MNEDLGELRNPGSVVKHQMATVASKDFSRHVRESKVVYPTLPNYDYQHNEHLAHVEGID